MLRRRLPARQHRGGRRCHDGQEVSEWLGLPGGGQELALAVPECPVAGGQPGAKQGCDAADAGVLGVVRGLLQDMLNERRMINEVQGTRTAAQGHNLAKVRCGVQEHVEWIAPQRQGNTHPGSAAWARHGSARRRTTGAAGGAACLLSVARLIACKDASLFNAFSCPWTPPSTFYNWQTHAEQAPEPKRLDHGHPFSCAHPVSTCVPSVGKFTRLRYYSSGVWARLLPQVLRCLGLLQREMGGPTPRS